MRGIAMAIMGATLIATQWRSLDRIKEKDGVEAAKAFRKHSTSLCFAWLVMTLVVVALGL